MKTVTLFDRSDVDWKSDPGMVIVSLEELTAALAHRINGRPRIFELLAPNGARLLIGLGGAYATAHFEFHSAETSWDAKTGSVRVSDDAEFLLGATPTPIASDYLLSPEEATDIAKYFFETGERNPTAEWDQA